VIGDKKVFIRLRQRDIERVRISMEVRLVGGIRGLKTEVRWIWLRGWSLLLSDEG